MWKPRISLASSNPEYQLDNGDGWPLDDGFTVQNNNFQTTFFETQAEFDLNQNEPGQKDAKTFKLSWDNKKKKKHEKFKINFNYTGSIGIYCIV